MYITSRVTQGTGSALPPSDSRSSCTKINTSYAHAHNSRTHDSRTNTGLTQTQTTHTNTERATAQRRLIVNKKTKGLTSRVT